jgi:hypothetical protein
LSAIGGVPDIGAEWPRAANGAFDPQET